MEVYNYDPVDNALNTIVQCKNGKLPKSYLRRIEIQSKIDALIKERDSLDYQVDHDILAEAHRCGQIIYCLGYEVMDYYCDDGRIDQWMDVYYEGSYSTSKEDLQKILDKRYPTNGNSELEEDRPTILERLVSPKQKRQLLKDIKFCVENRFEERTKKWDCITQLLCGDIRKNPRRYGTTDEEIAAVEEQLSKYFGKELIEKYRKLIELKDQLKKILKYGDRKYEDLNAEDRVMVNSLRDQCRELNIADWDSHRINWAIIYRITKRVTPHCLHHWFQDEVRYEIEVPTDINDPWKEQRVPVPVGQREISVRI